MLKKECLIKNQQISEKIPLEETKTVEGEENNNKKNYHQDPQGDNSTTKPEKLQGEKGAL